MSVWFAIPSKRPRAEAEPVVRAWLARGYRVALFRNEGDEPMSATMVVTGRYEGYARTVNYLCRQILGTDAAASWIVTGGDDTMPDPDHDPLVVAIECAQHFAGPLPPAPAPVTDTRPEFAKAEMERVSREVQIVQGSWLRRATFGVMQPTGDRWGERPGRSAAIDRVAGSPWLGREWCRTMYRGQGPLCEAYFHMYVDQELQEVAKRMGVFWQRPDLTQHHDHWLRTGKGEPEFLRRANAEFGAAQIIFNRREDENFPGHEPLPPEGL